MRYVWVVLLAAGCGVGEAALPPVVHYGVCESANELVLHEPDGGAKTYLCLGDGGCAAVLLGQGEGCFDVSAQ